jgi:DNA-binding SARP family transcriptional activator
MPGEPNPSRLQNGCDPCSPPLRVYLTGDVCIEAGDALLHERLLPGAQARDLLAFLVAEHHRVVGHDEIAEELWDGSPTAAWTASLKALVSRIRATLATTGLAGTASIATAPGVYRFRLPADGWIDFEAARSAVHEAETSLAGGLFTDAARGVCRQADHGAAAAPGSERAVAAARASRPDGPAYPFARVLGASPDRAGPRPAQCVTRCSLSI